MRAAKYVPQYCHGNRRLRTALLSALKQSDTGELRAGMMLGGRSVLEWQGQLMLGLGCERIICLSHSPGPAVLSLQRRVESHGLEFHAIRSNLQFVSLMRADDELVMLLDGLLADPGAVRAFAGDGDRIENGIATFPATHSLVDRWPDDFERIDRDRHWAGFAILRASHVHKLADLPPDGVAMSLLLRLSLQARTQCRNIDGIASEDGCWMLASDSDALNRRERTLIDNATNVPPWTGPGRALAATLVRRIAPRWLGHGIKVSSAIAGGLLLAGVVFAGLGWGAAGLAAAAIGAFGASTSETWDDLCARLWLPDHGKPRHSIALLKKVTDVAAALTLILALGLEAGLVGLPILPTNNLPSVALPILVLGAAHQATLVSAERSAAFWRDRPLHLTLFSAAAFGGYLAEAIALFGLGAMVQLMLRRAQ